MDKTVYSGSKRTSASNGVGSPKGDIGGSRRLSSYLQSAAQISGVVTIIAATVYALGVFTLVLPMSNSYNSPFTVAWYTVSVVPKTVVVGHGIKSLVWPSLALTVATTLFALMVLWLLYTMSIGWRYARQIARQPIPYLTSLAVIYSLLAGLIFVSFSALWPAWVQGSGLDLPSPGFALYAQRSLTFMIVPLDLLIVLLCSAIAVFVVARGVRYTRRLIASRALPRMSFRGFIFKGLLLMWLTLSLSYSLERLEGYFPETTFIWKVMFTAPWYLFGYLFLSFALFALVAMLLLILSGLRYSLKLIKEAKRNNKTIASPSAALAGWGTSAVQRTRANAPIAGTLPYSVVLFLTFYVVALLAMNVLYSFVLPLIDHVQETIKAESRLDEFFVPLVVFGAFITLVVMYRNGWKGFGRFDDYVLADDLANYSWLSFSKDLLANIGSRSLRSGLFWSLGVAYVIALAAAFLLAELSPPPCPRWKLTK